MPQTCSISISVPAKSFGCKNSTGLPWAPILRVPIAEYARALGFELVAGGDDVLDLVAEMVHAAVRIALEKLGDRRVRAKRMQEFDFRIGQFDEDDRHAMVGLRLRSGDARAERFAIDARRFFEVGDGDGDVVELADHRLPEITCGRGAKLLHQRRGSRPRIRSNPCLIAAKRASIMGSNSLAVKM